jgi:DNA-binding GntR family transcriptional regulator
VNSAPVEAISTTSLADEIAFRLQTAILDGVYPPGTHLFQDELYERFGVSRTPVREALRKLQAQHLVVHVPNKGATVRFRGREELIDVYDVRSELEGYACELAAGNVTAEMLATLDRAQADVEEALRRFASVDVGRRTQPRWTSRSRAPTQPSTTPSRWLLQTPVRPAASPGRPAGRGSRAASPTAAAISNTRR